jgi:hypothetical protein
MKVDRSGNICCTGPEGFSIMSSKGTHLATIKTKELRANLARGDVDAQTVISDRAHRSLPDTPVDRRVRLSNSACSPELGCDYISRE